MAYVQQSKLQMILISQISIVIMSLISAFFREYFTIAIIIYTFVIMGITSYSTMRKAKPRPEDLKVHLFKENNAMKIALADKLLNKELMKQMKGTMLMFVTLPIAFVVFPLYINYLSPIVQGILSDKISDPILISFLNFFIMYEFVFSIITVVRVAVISKYTYENIMLPQQYTVYKTGVLSENRMFIRFEEGHCFKYNPKRRFIEIVNPNTKGFRLRLYTERVSELKDKLVNIAKLKECETS